jgi:hypothetical protein
VDLQNVSRGSPLLSTVQTYVLERVDSLCGLLDLATDDLGDELGCECGQGAAGSLALNDLNHLLADGSDLGRGSICGLLDLVLAALGESNTEETEEVVIGGLDGDVGLDQGLPFADERSELVGCEVETVKVGQAVLSLNLVDSELNLSESVVLILLQICQRNLEDSTLQCIVGVLETGGSVDESLADTVISVRLFEIVGYRLSYSLTWKEDGA